MDTKTNVRAVIDSTDLNPGLTRIFIIGSHAAADSFESHIVDSLLYMGFSATLFELRRHRPGIPRVIDRAAEKITATLLREPELRIERRLTRAINDYCPTLILVVLGNQLSPKTVARIRTIAKVPIVCWCQDQMTTLNRQFLLGAEYDAVFVKDRYLQDLFSRMIKCTPFYYLPEACNPRVHRTLTITAADRQKYGCDVMIAGTLYYYRQELLRQLADFKIKIWGRRPDWLLYRLGAKHPQHEVVLDEKARAARAASICLNTLHYGEVNGLNCRAFEIAGCGGFQLITDVPVLKEHFVPGQEVVIFRSADDMIDQVRYYLAHPESAAEIALRGQLRAHSDHSYERRLRELLQISLGKPLHLLGLRIEAPIDAVASA